MEEVSPILEAPQKKGVKPMPEKTEAQKKAQKKYMEKFVEVKVRMTPERRSAVQAHAEAQGESTTGFINRAIDETIARDNAAGEAAEGRK